MTKVDVMEAQAHLAELLTGVDDSGERITIFREGQAVAAIISYEELQRLEALEDAIDSENMRRAIAEHDGEFVTPETLIANYNKLHDTDFTMESIMND
ncbi:MAG: type II toxin-antitoxin system Phd/YefM family antitoxin [Hormoscilla sp. GM102CHS1]|nr:type II toxin-antitoxin system Phd/YefM family antitoxin [Hormoscilla sp. GM102CHS1]